MGGSTKTNTVTKQDNTPWGPAQPSLTNIYSAADNAYAATSKDPYAGPYYADQSQATQMSQLFGMQLAGNQMGQGNAVISDSNSLYEQLMKQLTPGWQPEKTSLDAINYGGAGYDYNPQGASYSGTNSTYQPTSVKFDGTNSTLTPEQAQYQGKDFNYRPTGASYNPAATYNYQQLDFNPLATNIEDYGMGSDYMNQVIAAAGQTPLGGGDAELQAAIEAAINPVQRQLLEKVLPAAKLNLVGSGVYGGQSGDYTIADEVNSKYTQQAQDIASTLGYQDFTRRAQNDQALYQQKLDMSGKAASSAFDRQLQDFLTRQGLIGQQGQQMNAIGADQARLAEEQAQFASTNQLNNNAQMMDAEKFATTTANQNSLTAAQLFKQFQDQLMAQDQFRVNTANSNAQTGANIALQNNQQGFDANKYNVDTANANEQFMANLFGQNQDRAMQSAQFATQNAQQNAQGTMAAQQATNQQTLDADDSFAQQMLQMMQQQPALAQAMLAAQEGRISAMNAGNALNEAPINAMNAIGTQQDAYNQQVVEALYRQWQDQLNAPWQGLEPYRNAITGYPTSSSGTSSSKQSGGGLF